MDPESPDEPVLSASGDLDLDAVFGGSSPGEAFAAVLTEARMVLGEIGGPLDAELWGSDILAALGGSRSEAPIAMVPAAEAAGTAEALAILRVLAAVGWPPRASTSRPGRPRSARPQSANAGAMRTTRVFRKP